MTFHEIRTRRMTFHVLALSALLFPVALPQINAPKRAPYVATPQYVVAAMLELADVKKSDLVYDLGCGDGRIIISAAKDYGARGVCVEIDPDLLQQSRLNAQKAGVEKRIEFRLADLFETDIRDATVITLYLLPEVNLELRQKLLKDLKSGTRIVSHSFDMGDWKPNRLLVFPGGAVYLWTIPARK
jgi:SAM-dependent methyltransferase